MYVSVSLCMPLRASTKMWATNHCSTSDAFFELYVGDCNGKEGLQAPLCNWIRQLLLNATYTISSHTALQIFTFQQISVIVSVRIY